MRKNTLFITGAILLAVAIVFIAVNQSKNDTDISDPQSTSAALQGEQIPLLEAFHIQDGLKADYNSNPPTSGNHYGAPANWGVSEEPLSDESVVHTLEHGGIWISYQPNISGQTVQQLKVIAEIYPQAVVMSPRQENDSPIALASWGRLQKMQVLDEQSVYEFIQSNVNNSPEKFASIANVVDGVPVTYDVGDIFPDFSLIDVDGKTFTRDSFSGKPSIMWFTTEFCVPCQIGARVVAKLDDELGGDAFDVFVVFVDPRETKEDLISWRERFANDDWIVAFDNFDDSSKSLSSEINLKFLDTKYLLDKDGAIQNIDFQIADERYVDIIRNVVKDDQ